MKQSSGSILAGSRNVAKLTTYETEDTTPR